MSKAGAVHLHLLATCYKLHILPSGDVQPLLDCVTSMLRLNFLSDLCKPAMCVHTIMILFVYPPECLTAAEYSHCSNII